MTALIIEEWPHMSKFGEWLREARERKGWSGDRLAEEIGTSQGTISMYERGKRRPLKDRVKKIAVALDVPVDRAISAWLEEDAPEAEGSKESVVFKTPNGHLYYLVDRPADSSVPIVIVPEVAKMLTSIGLIMEAPPDEGTEESV